MIRVARDKGSVWRGWRLSENTAGKEVDCAATSGDPVWRAFVADEEHGLAHPRGGDRLADAVPRGSLSRPLLTIAVPAFERPDGVRSILSRVLESVEHAQSEVVEVVVSDDSTDDGVSHVVPAMLKGSCVAWRYERNRPKLGMAENWNRAVSISSGRHILVLHDDDNLAPKGLERILSWLAKYPHPFMLFGVQVVGPSGRVLKRQVPRRSRLLIPAAALLKLASESSFVRFPGVVVSRDAYEMVGKFDPGCGYVADLDMWVRLADTFGMRLCSAHTVNYRVHSGALTNRMFTRDTLDDIEKVLQRIESTGRIPQATFVRARASFLHQFILAGAFRAARKGKWRQASNVMRLLSTVPFDARPSLRWRVVRSLFELLW